MKTRNGFVSNSSTSSFVLVGFLMDEGPDYKATIRGLFSDVPEDEDEFWDWLHEEAPCYVRTGSDDGIPDGKIFLGRKVAETSDYEMPEKNLDLLGVVKELEELRVKMGLPEDLPARLLTGTRCC